MNKKVILLIMAGMAVVCLQAGMLKYAMSRSQRMWAPLVAGPACDSTGQRMAMAGFPFGVGAVGYDAAAPTRIGTESYDVCFLSASGNRPRVLQALRARLPILVWSNRAEWSADGRLALITGISPRLLVFRDGSTKTVASMSLQKFLPARDSYRISGLDVLGWNDDKVLCRFAGSAFSRRTGEGYLFRYVTVDIRTGSVSTVYESSEPFGEPQYKTGCFLADGSVLLISIEKLIRVWPDNHVRGLGVRIPPPISLEYSPECGRAVVLSENVETGDRSLYSLDVSGAASVQELLTDRDISDPIVTCKGDVIARVRGRVEILSPVRRDLGPAFRFAAGAIGNDILIWRWNRDRLLFDAYDRSNDRHTSAMIPLSVPRGGSMFEGINWRYYGIALGDAVVPLLLLVMLAYFCVKWLPPRIRDAIVALLMLAGYLLYKGDMSLFVQMGQILGGSLGLLCAVDVLALVTLGITWLLNVKGKSRGLAALSWTASSSSAAYACTFAVGIVVAILINALYRKHMHGVDPSMLLPLAVYQLGYVAPIEETIFRGYLWRQLESWGLRSPAVLCTQAALFALVHLIRPSPMWGILHVSSAYYAASLFVCGILWGLLRMRWRTLLLPTIAHGVFNIVTTVLYG